MNNKQKIQILKHEKEMLLLTKKELEQENNQMIEYIRTLSFGTLVIGMGLGILLFSNNDITSYSSVGLITTGTLYTFTKTLKITKK